MEFGIASDGIHFLKIINIESPCATSGLWPGSREQHKNKYLLFSEQGEISGELSR